MHHPVIVAAGLVGLALILSVTIWMSGRLRIEQQRTLQQLIDRGVAAEDLLRLAGISTGRQRDRRRGLLLLALGLGWSGVTVFIGGPAWKLGALPALLGLGLLLLARFDARAH